MDGRASCARPGAGARAGVKCIVLAQGKLKNDALASVADDYKSRLQRYVAFEEIEVKDTAGLARRLPKEGRLVMLEVWGEVFSSEGLAARLEHWGSQGKGQVCFVIGGADGIPKNLSSRAHVHLSLSALTLPHRLARVLLYEQLYRCMSILRGEPYAREH